MSGWTDISYTPKKTIQQAINDYNNKHRNFDDDLTNSNNPQLRKDWERIIKLKFGNDCSVLWKDDINTQKGFGTDTTVQTSKGRRYSIELKTRNNNCKGNDTWIMEIISHVYNKEDKETRTHLWSKEGWIYTTTAEYIFHATLNEDGTRIIDCIFYSLTPFKTDAWKSEFDKYDNLWLPTPYPNGTFQLTLNKLIPRDVIKSCANEFWELP